MKMLIGVVLAVGVVAAVIFYYVNFFPKNLQNISALKPLETPAPSPIVLKEALPRDAYTIIMVGDSMTESLGPNADKLREYLKINYPNKVFGIYNLAKGSTNILSVQEILDKD